MHFEFFYKYLTPFLVLQAGHLAVFWPQEISHSAAHVCDESRDDGLKSKVEIVNDGQGRGGTSII